MLGVAACDQSPAPKATVVDKVRVLGTVYPLAQVAGEVGAGQVQTEWLIEQGQSLEELNPTPELRSRIARADLVITNGSGEEWAAAGFDDAMRANSIVRLDVLDAARTNPGARQLWLDPVVIREAASLIAQRLAAKRPERGAFFRENSARFAADVDALMSEFDARIAGIKGKAARAFRSIFASPAATAAHRGAAGVGFGTAVGRR